MTSTFFAEQIPIDLQILRPRRPRGLGALGSPGKRSWVARLAVRLASSPALINFSHSFRVFSLEPSRPGAILNRSDGPGVNFGGYIPCFFALRRPSLPFVAFFVQEQQNTVKRGTQSTSEFSRDETKTRKIRSGRHFDNARRHGRVRTAPGVVPRASREPSGRSPDVSETVLEPSAGSQERSRGDFFALRGRSGASRAASE